MKSDAGDAKGIVARVIALLRAFADGETALAISQLSERLNLPASSVHRLLEQLLALDMVERANFRRYRIGPEFFRISTRVERKFRVTDVARPLMQKLSTDMNESCVLSVLMRSGQKRLRVAKLDPPQQTLMVRIPVPECFSLVWGAAGRAILAHLSPEEIEANYASADRVSPTGKRLFTLRWLMKELERVRANGFAFAEGELFSSETVAVAAPFFGPNAQVVGSLSIVVPTFRFSESALGPLSARLLEATEQLSRILGAVGARQISELGGKPSSGKACAKARSAKCPDAGQTAGKRRPGPSTPKKSRSPAATANGSPELILRSAHPTHVKEYFEKGKENARQQPDDRNSGVPSPAARNQH